MRGWARAAGLGCRLIIASAASAASGQEPAPGVEATDAQEQIARREVQGLRAAARKLRRLSVELEKSKAGGDRRAAYVKWLDSADLRIASLAGRWASSLNYFYRDYPREALLADPERLAHGLVWLSELNTQLGGEAAELAESLAKRNETFAPDVSESHIRSVRSILATFAD